MKRFLAGAALAAGLAFSHSAVAHEAKPRHGGIVRSAGDLSFELVARDGGATIYVVDHGKDLPTRGASGALVVLKGKEKTEFPLEAGGGNTLVAKGGAALAPGSKAVAAITFADKKTVSVRFPVK